MFAFARPVMLAAALAAVAIVPLPAQTPPGPDANNPPQAMPPAPPPDTARAPCGYRLESMIRSVTDKFEGAPLSSEAQRQAYDAFMAAAAKARAFVREACANERSAANIRQIESAERKIGEALAALRPALENFYASLSPEQKAQLNNLPRQLEALGKDWWRETVREFQRQLREQQARAPDGPGKLHFCIGTFCIPVPEEFAGAPRDARPPEPPPVAEDRI
ncbi:MAG: Spy/CpxP family protein refolding chaperone [Sphingomonadaceae bacterium]